MARSSVKKNTKRVKDKQKKLNYIPHPVMAAHWDKKLTWKQNYEKFGLQARLRKSIKDLVYQTTEFELPKENSVEVRPGHVALEIDPEKIPLGEARLIRNTETNEVTEIIYGRMEPNVVDSESKKVPIIDDLIKHQREHAKPGRKQTLSELECHWLAGLHKKYGDNYEKMKWDQKLNPMFLSVGQLKKKMEIWLAM